MIVCVEGKANILKFLDALRAQKFEDVVILMNGVNLLVGVEKPDEHPFPPFSDEACRLLANISRRLLISARDFPDVISFAYWCRPSNLSRLKAKYPNLDCRLGRGLVFHITPSNIPINFAFSFAFALLAGNSSIVRVPSKPFKQISLICSAIEDALKEDSFFCNKLSFVSYERDEVITAHFSLMADVRMLWGGDHTIQILRSNKLKPRCIDITFADRYSLAILDGDAVYRMDEKAMARLAEAFYNDTYLVDQNACSSPQLILWINGSVTTRERFWNAVFTQVEKKYELQAETAVSKFTQLCRDSIETRGIKSYRMKNLLYRIELPQINEQVQYLRGVGGYFFEYCLQSLDELIDVVTDRFQTITYFGIDPCELRQFIIGKHLRGIDRIVPIGKAVDIGVIWDGYDLIETMSRVVSLQ
jgi:hypothetical protein